MPESDKIPLCDYIIDNSGSKEDLKNEELTPNGTKYRDLYLKMMLSLSLTHAGNVGLWTGGNQFSDAVTRYDIYKQMHFKWRFIF